VDHAHVISSLPKGFLSVLKHALVKIRLADYQMLVGTIAEFSKVVKNVHGHLSLMEQTQHDLLSDQA
jgi:hypothetical protein